MIVNGYSRCSGFDGFVILVSVGVLCTVEALASAALQSMAVEDVESKWPWKRALGKFDSVQPGKKIWYVPASSLVFVVK